MSGPRKEQAARKGQAVPEHTFPQYAISSGKQFVSCWREKRQRNLRDSGAAENKTVAFSDCRCISRVEKTPHNSPPQTLFL